LALSDLDRDQIGDIVNDPPQFKRQDQAIVQVIAASTSEQREKLRDVYPEHVAAFEALEDHNETIKGPQQEQEQQQEQGNATVAGDSTQVVIPGTEDLEERPFPLSVAAESSSVLLSAQTTNALDALKLSLEYIQRIRQLIPQIEESRLGTPLLNGLLVEVDTLGDEMEALVTPSPAERAIVTARGQFAIHWLRRFVGVMKGA
jgi:hypothetical protein